MEEIWRSLDGLVECGKYYEVSNLGNVKSVDRTIIRKNGYPIKVNGQRIKSEKDKNGYFKIKLTECGNTKNYKLHRLVAIAFIPNPNNLPCINHKDENKSNNTVYNLEWCDHKYNNNYGTLLERKSKIRKGVKFSEEHKKKISESNKGKGKSEAHKRLIGKAKSIPVKCYIYETMKFVKIFNSGIEAAKELGLDRSAISKVCKGKQKQHCGYYFEFFKEED